MIAHAIHRLTAMLAGRGGAVHVHSLKISRYASSTQMNASCDVVFTGKAARDLSFSWELRDTSAHGTPIVARTTTNLPTAIFGLDHALAPTHRYRLHVTVRNGKHGKTDQTTMYFTPGAPVPAVTRKPKTHSTVVSV